MSLSLYAISAATSLLSYLKWWRRHRRIGGETRRFYPKE